jgi:hypothetical protein
VADRKSLSILSGLVLTVLLAWAHPVFAQLQPAYAEVAQVNGPVEVMRRGQPQWIAATNGTRLVEGDQIRALSKGSAELSLADRSTIFVAENTRFAIVKLDHDAQTGARNSAFHLVVGKVRAEVTRASLQLVRTRQSNFTISTPLGVAAVRGTVMVVTYTPDTSASPTQTP